MSLCKNCNIVIPLSRYTRRKDVRYCSNKCLKAKWRECNPEKHKQSQTTYLTQNKEKRAASSKAYTQRNRAYYAQYSTLRARKMQQAKPAWADEKVISWFYEEAAYFGLEVDHVIPISHKLVCGLHVPANLQLLTRSENAKKSNKFADEDIICKITKVIKENE